MDKRSNPENRLEKKRLRGSDEDKLSNLPDLLLLHILSYVSTKDAVRTSILSLRWRNLWKSVPCLDLETNQFSAETDFYNFMERFLDFHDDLYLHKFILKFHVLVYEHNRLSSWIRTAITCNVEHLYFKEAQVPQSLFMCDTLVVLKLKNVIVGVPEFVSLPSLKIMHLKGATFPDYLAFKSLISSCPALEELRIVRRSEDNLRVLYICSHTLKKLSTDFTCFRKNKDPKEWGVVIDAPCLEYFGLRDLFSRILIKNHGLSLEADIDLGFNVRWGKVYEGFIPAKRLSNICRFLGGIYKVKKLKISWETFEQIRRTTCGLALFPYLIHLEAEFNSYRWEVFYEFLECCPSLKSFAVTIEFCAERDSVRLPSSVEWLLSSIESITIKIKGPVYEHITEVDMIGYFLKNSVVLKEFKIYLSMCSGMKEISAIRKKVSEFTRRSKTCQVYIGLWRGYSSS